MSILNAYWVPPAVQDFVVHEDNPRAGDLGFRNDIPVELPVTVGAQYFGEGREELPIYPKTLNSSTQAEYHAVGGAIPASGGIPLVNIYANEYKHSRADYERPFQTASGIPIRPKIERVLKK